MNIIYKLRKELNFILYIVTICPGTYFVYFFFLLFFFGFAKFGFGFKDGSILFFVFFWREDYFFLALG